MLDTHQVHVGAPLVGLAHEAQVPLRHTLQPGIATCRQDEVESIIPCPRCGLHILKFASEAGRT